MPRYLPIDPDNPGSDDGGGTAGGGTGTSTGTLIFSKDFVKDEETSTLRVIAYMSVASPDDLQFNSYIILDGRVVQVSVTNLILVAANAKGTATPFVYLDGVSAGSHNIKLTIKNTEEDNATLTVYAGATIEIAELKQGAR